MVVLSKCECHPSTTTSTELILNHVYHAHTHLFCIFSEASDMHESKYDENAQSANLHESKYDEIAQSASLTHSTVPNLGPGKQMYTCISVSMGLQYINSFLRVLLAYSLMIYPTDEFIESYSTNNP